MVLAYGEVRATRDALRYGFAVGKVRVLATRMLDAAAFERLLDARDFAEQKRLLSDTVYGRHLESVDSADGVERALEAALEEFYGFLSEAQLPSEVERFFRIRYDFDNLKAALKAKSAGVSPDGFLVGHGTVELSVFTQEAPDYPEALSSVAEGLATGTQETPIPSADIDIAVDRAFFAERLELARHSGSVRLVSAARLAADVANIKTLVRGTLAGMEPEHMGSLLIAGGSMDVAMLRELAGMSLADIGGALKRIPALRRIDIAEVLAAETIDPVVDGLLTECLRGGWSEPLGPEPVIAYVGARESEVRVLRVLLLGALMSIDSEVVRGRVSHAVGRR